MKKTDRVATPKAWDKWRITASSGFNLPSGYVKIAMDNHGNMTVSWGFMVIYGIPSGCVRIAMENGGFMGSDGILPSGND